MDSYVAGHRGAAGAWDGAGFHWHRRRMSPAGRTCVLLPVSSSSDSPAVDNNNDERNILAVAAVDSWPLESWPGVAGVRRRWTRDRSSWLKSTGQVSFFFTLYGEG